MNMMLSFQIRIKPSDVYMTKLLKRYSKQNMPDNKTNHSTFIAEGSFGSSSNLTPRLLKASIDISDNLDILCFVLKKSFIISLL